MTSKFSNLFIWWSGQTLGTILYTKLFGIQVGFDEHGNRYYKNHDGKKRWVNYNGDCDASAISPKWYSWLHKTTNSLPKSNEDENNSNYKKYLNSNPTGSVRAYHPNKNVNISKYNDYTPWKPDN